MVRDDECLALLKRQDEKLDRLSERMEEHHLATMERIHKLEIQVDSHQRAFSAFKWLASSGGIAGILAFLKDSFLR